MSRDQGGPCIDVYTIPAHTNETAVFSRALDSLLQAYGNLDLFRLVTYDAGACSKANAEHIRARGLHYLFGLKGSQPGLRYWWRSAPSMYAMPIPRMRAPWKATAAGRSLGRCPSLAERVGIIA